MSDIFSSQVSEGQAIQQSIGQPGITPERAAGVVIDADDQYDVIGARRVEQLNKQQAAERAERERRRQLEKMREQQEDIGASLLNRYKQINAEVSNPVERNRLRREAELSALATGGKENYSYIKALSDRASTSREARPDGMVNVLDADGNVIGVEGESREAIIESMMDANRQKIDEVFPNSLNSLEGLLDLDRSTNNQLSEGTVSDTIQRFRNESSRLKRASNQFHIQANTLPSSELPKLKEQATATYMSSVAGIFNTFTSPDMLKAVRSGQGITRADIMASIQQVRTDVVDEIVGGRVPIDIQDVDAYIQQTVDNIDELYQRTEKADVASLEIEHKTIKLKNDIVKEQFRNKFNLAEVEGAQSYVDFMAKAAATSSDLMNASMIATDSGTRGLLEKQAKGMVDLSGSLMPVYENMQKHIFQSTFDLNDFEREVKKANTPEDAALALDKLAKVTNHTAGWALAPHVKGAVERSMPEIQRMIDNGLLTPESAEEMFGQLGSYEEHAKSMIVKTGAKDEESWLSQGFNAVMDFFKTQFGGAPIGQPTTGALKRPNITNPLDNTNTNQE